MHLHAGEAYPLAFAHAFDHRPREAGEFGAVVGRSLQRVAARYYRIAALPKRTRELELERHRACAHAVSTQPPPERVGMRDQHPRQLQRIEREVVLERALLAVGLALVV